VRSDYLFEVNQVPQEIRRLAKRIDEECDRRLGMTQQLRSRNSTNLNSKRTDKSVEEESEER
jgi:hypothetical protein